MINITDIFNIAKRDKWVMEYNPDLDSLYWSKPKISPSTQLKKFLQDFSLYITEQGLIEGLFIEYAKGNFISHNTEYAELINKMVKVNDIYVLPQNKVKGVEPLLKSMANMVGNETFDAVNKGLDLEKFVMTR
ncbi:MAG: hypothetical protein NUV47_03550 [Patescibacteria group bacterium]|nr:hypothetical protein [Patescibacteria group bacterium]